MRASGPGQSVRLLLDVVAVLAQQQIDYAVIGAMAASVHGAVRASLDADAVLSLPAEGLSELAARFKAPGLQTELRRGDFEDPIAALLEISDVYGNRVDLLAGLRGLEAAAFSRAIEVPFQGTSLRVIGREDFIAMKLFAGGPIDLDDARQAIEDAESLDIPLLRRLTDRYGSAATTSLNQLLIG